MEVWAHRRHLYAKARLRAGLHHQDDHGPPQRTPSSPWGRNPLSSTIPRPEMLSLRHALSGRGDHGGMGIELRRHPHRPRSSAAAAVRGAALRLLSHPGGAFPETAAGAVAQPRGLWLAHQAPGSSAFSIMAMTRHITPGLASLVVQTQVFFTIGIVSYLSGERIKPFQRRGAIDHVGRARLLIVMHTDGSTTRAGPCARARWPASAGRAATWSCGARLASTCWLMWCGRACSPVPPLLACSFMFEGWPAIRDGLASCRCGHLGGAVLVAGGRQHAVRLRGVGLPAVALSGRHSWRRCRCWCPIFGMGASALWLGEPLQDWKLEAAALVMAGLALNVLWPRLAAPRRANRDPDRS